MSRPPDTPSPSGPAEFERAVPSGEAAVAVFEEEDTSLFRRLQHFLHGNPTVIPFIVLLLAVLLFSVIVGHRFLHPFNLSLVLQQVTIIGVVGIAQTLIILTAGIDLSVGAIMILSSVVMGRTCVVYGVPLVIAFPLGLLVGLACGVVNGVIVTMLRLPPFIVTLGTWSIFGALNIYYSRSETIRQQDVEAVAPFLQFTGTVIKPYDFLLNHLGLTVPFLKGSVITYGSILMVLLAVLIWYVLNRTAFGRHVYATGDDPDAARLAGISPNRTLISVYALAGLICAIAAWVLIGRIGGVSPQGGQDANLDSITAVVIGGTSLFGGRGGVAGTFIGTLIVVVLKNGLTQAGIDSLYQQIATGALVMLAVGADQYLGRGHRA